MGDIINTMSVWPKSSNPIYEKSLDERLQSKYKLPFLVADHSRAREVNSYHVGLEPSLRVKQHLPNKCQGHTPPFYP